MGDEPIESAGPYLFFTTATPMDANCPWIVRINDGVWANLPCNAERGGHGLPPTPSLV